MSAVARHKRIVAEYLALERDAEFKSEFYNGVMYPLHRDGATAMTGASPWHTTVKENLIVELGGELKKGPCRSYSSG